MTATLNGEEIHFLGSGQNKQNPTFRFYNVFSFNVDLKKLEFPKDLDFSTFESMIPIQAQFKSMTRLDFERVIITVELNGYRYSYHLRVRNKVPVKAISYRANLNHYKPIGELDDKMVLYNISRKQLCIKYAGGLPKEEILYLPVFHEFEFDEIRFFTGIGRIAIICINQDLYFFDITSEILDPLQRLISIQEIKTPFTGKPLFTVNSFEWMGYISISLYFPGRKIPETFLVSMYGQKYFMRINARETNQRTTTINFAPSNLESSAPINRVSVMLKAFNSLIVAVPKYNKVPVAGDRLRDGFRLDDILAYSSDITQIAVIQTDKIAAVSPAIERISDTDPIRKSFPNRSLGSEEDFQLAGDFLILVNKRTLTVKNLVTEDEQTIELEFRPLLARVFYEARQVNKLFHIVLLQYGKPNGYGFTSAHIYSFLSDPIHRLRYVSSVVPNFCDCDYFKLALITESTGFVAIAVMHIRETDRGNMLVLSFLEINSATLNPANPDIAGTIIARFIPDLRLQTIPNKILHFEVLSTDYAVVCYTFLEDTSYIGIFTVNILASSSIGYFTYTKKKFTDVGILTDDSMLDCDSSLQDLTISCLIYFEALATKIVSISLKFSFEEEQGLVPTLNYILPLPNEYSLIKMFKGVTTDIVMANYKDHLKVLFYDTETRKIISELGVEDFPPNFDDLILAQINEDPRYTFTFAVPGANLKDMRFVRQTPKLFLDKKALSKSDYKGYFLEIQGLKGRKEYYRIDKIFDLEPKTSTLMILTSIGLLLTCFIGLACIICCYWWGPSKHEMAPVATSREVGGMNHDDSVMTTTDDHRIPITRFSRLDSTYKKALFNFSETLRD